jgi:hypothetical protein
VRRRGLVAAREAPAQVAQRQGIDSSFFTLFSYTADVGPFTAGEARDLIASAPVPVPEADVRWMLEQSHGWPLLLQILCREWLVAMEDGLTDATWRATGLRQLAPFRALLASPESG